FRVCCCTRRRPPRPPLLPYTTLFRSLYFGKLAVNFIFMTVVAIVLLPLITVLFDVSMFKPLVGVVLLMGILGYAGVGTLISSMRDRKSTRLNSSHVKISYAVFCLKKK